MAAAAPVVMAISLLPYVSVSAATPPDLRFAGALVNAPDAQSYLAKMRQGYDGQWLFRLPFTADDEADALLFTYHLALGHIARLAGLPLTTVYQLARLAGGCALLLVVYAFAARALDSISDRRWAWAFVAVSSGLGWLGFESTDITIPESNTFFSILANAHFALATALMLVVFMAVLDGRPLRAALAALALAVIQPFAPLALFAVLLVHAGTRWLAGRGLPARRQIIAAVAAGAVIAPLLVYFYVTTQRDPMLREWTAQNVTPSPSPVAYVLGYGLLLLLAIPGGLFAWRRGREVDALLVAWAVTCGLLLYAPFALQRRFALGLHVPIAVLGVMGLLYVVAPRLPAAAARWLPRLVFGATALTTLLLLAATSSAAMRPDAQLFFSANESAAFDWLRDNVSHDAVILAAPQTGLFLPAWGAARVVYGHPFETLHANATRARVEQFFTGDADRPSVLDEFDVDYIFFGPRERALGAVDESWTAAFSTGDVTIFRAP